MFMNGWLRARKAWLFLLWLTCNRTCYLQMGDNGKPLALTSHTLAPVPVFIGGKGLPEDMKFRCARLVSLCA